MRFYCKKTRQTTIIKNTIIKILAENQQHANNTKELDSSESFKTVKGTFIKNRQNHRTLSAPIDMILLPNR